MPVLNAERLVEHTAPVTNARSNRMPFRASASRFGVRNSGTPYSDKCGLISSAMIQSTLGRRSAARPTAAATPISTTKPIHAFIPRTCIPPAESRARKRPAIAGRTFASDVILNVAGDLDRADLACYGAARTRRPYPDKVAREGSAPRLLPRPG